MNKIDTCITDINKLKDWFQMCQRSDEPKPFFTIYRGPDIKVERTIYRNTEISDPAEAWDAMQNILEMHSEHGGVFRIFVTARPAHNSGLGTLYKVPNPWPQMMPGMNPAISGMYPGAYPGAPGIREIIEQELSKERKLWELEQQIKDLKAEQDAKVGEMDNMMQEFMPIVKDLAHKFGMKMMGYGAAPQMPAPAPMAGHHEPDVDVPEGYDYEVIEPALDQLREVVPDVENSLQKLARYAKQNPEMIRGLLQNLE